MYSTCLQVELHLCTSSRLLYLSIVVGSGGLRIVCHIRASSQAAAAGRCQHLPTIWLSCAQVAQSLTAPQMLICSWLMWLLFCIICSTVSAVASSMAPSHSYFVQQFVDYVVRNPQPHCNCAGSCVVYLVGLCMVDF